jgi:uncharacterized protein YkwD
MNINIKKAVAATAVIASIAMAGGCATNHNADAGKDNGKAAQSTTEQPKDTAQTPAPAPTTPAPSQSGPDDNNGNGNGNGTGTSNDGTTFTQTLTDEEARALDQQGLRGGVISREDGYIVTRDGNTLTITVDKNATKDNGTVVAASDTKKPDTNNAAGETPAAGDNDGGSVVTPGGNDGNGTGTVTPGNPGHNIGDDNGGGFVPNPGPAPAPNPGTDDPAPAPAPEPEVNHTEQATAFMQTFRAKYLALINKARTDLGLKPLVASEQLTNSAQTWASRSAEDGLGGAHYRDWKNGENGGEDLAGVTSFKRENVSDTLATSGGHLGDANNTADAIADRLFNQTINQDPEHRKTVLDKDADRIGIGVSEAVIDGYLDFDGNAVHTDHKSQAIKTVVQTGNSANASQVGAEDKVAEYTSANTQEMGAVGDDKFNTALPKVEGSAPAEETPAPEQPAPVTPAPTEAATPSTPAPAETPAPVAEQPAAPAPVEHTVPAAAASTPDTGVALGVGE